MSIKKFTFLVGISIAISGCGVYQVVNPATYEPFSAYKKWHRKNTSIEETQKAMKECGYPSPEGAGREPDNNKIAAIQLCMEKKGFEYTGKLGTFCKNYPLLPACVKALPLAKDDEIHFPIPINPELKPTTYMDIRQPANFVPTESLEEFRSGKRPVALFWPSDATETSYLERFIVIYAIKSKDSLNQFVKFADHQFSTNKTGYRILSKWKQSNKEYNTEGFAAVYTLGRMKWLMYLQGYSGSDNFGVVTYEMAIPNTMSENEAVLKSKDFINTNVRLEAK
ncbi:MAG: hypothetical protein U1E78_03050 [Gammaproteobacteria bacterium]